MTMAALERQCAPYSLLLVGARREGSRTLALCAVAPPAEVFRRTEQNRPHAVGGVHWYCTEGYYIGFAPTATIDQRPAINYDQASEERLSWYLLDGVGGWRAGAAVRLASSTEWRKVILGLK